MFTLVIVIANVGGFYFQDKKEQQRNEIKN